MTGRSYAARMQRRWKLHLSQYQHREYRHFRNEELGRDAGKCLPPMGEGCISQIIPWLLDSEAPAPRGTHKLH